MVAKKVTFTIFKVKVLYPLELVEMIKDEIKIVGAMYAPV